MPDALPIPCVMCRNLHYTWEEMQACAAENLNGVRLRPSLWERLRAALAALSPVAVVRMVQAARRCEEAERTLEGVAAVKMSGIDVDGDRMTVHVKEPIELIRYLAEGMAQALDEAGAANYIEMRVWNRAQGWLVFHLQRCAGKTPHEFRLQAEAERDEALAELARCRGGEEPGDGHA